MTDLIGLPTGLFADEEILGSVVRLLVSWELEGGHALERGECFRVVEVFQHRLAEDGIELPPSRRWLKLRNHRACGVPVEAECCELCFTWPGVEKSNGR